MERVQEMIDAAITQHNRNASMISMCLGIIFLALFAEGFFLQRLSSLVEDVLYLEPGAFTLLLFLVGLRILLESGGSQGVTSPGNIDCRTCRILQVV